MGRLFSANSRWNRTPTPSKTPNKTPHPMALPTMLRTPPRAAKAPPVMKPDRIAFQGSSFCRYPLTRQSKLENMPPHTPKLPPTTGALALIAASDPLNLSPLGLFRIPLTPCQTVPPIAPIAKAPPKSFRMTQGQGSREWSLYASKEERSIQHGAVGGGSSE